MQANNLLLEGFNLMLLGMGFVFLFLAILILATTLMSRLITRYLPDPPAIPAPVQSAPRTQQPTETLAIIAAAIHQHRQRHP